VWCFSSSLGQCCFFNDSLLIPVGPGHTHCHTLPAFCCPAFCALHSFSTPCACAETLLIPPALRDRARPPILALSPQLSPSSRGGVLRVRTRPQADADEQAPLVRAPLAPALFTRQQLTVIYLYATRVAHQQRFATAAHIAGDSRCSVLPSFGHAAALPLQWTACYIEKRPLRIMARRTTAYNYYGL